MIALAAGAAAIPVMGRLQHEEQTVRLWLTFILLATATALAQVLLVKTPRNQSYHATMVFLLPAVLLLPPELVVLVAIVQHIPAWLKNRNGLVHRVVQHLQPHPRHAGGVGSAQLVLQADGLVANADLRFALAGCAASLVLVGLNHALLAPMLMLARGHSIKDSGLFSFHGLSTELVRCRPWVSSSPRSGTSIRG